MERRKAWEPQLVPNTLQDLARIIGILSAGGNVSQRDIKINDRDKEMILNINDLFRQVGLDTHIKINTLKSSDLSYKLIISSVDAVRYFGILNKNSWDTVTFQKHPWVFDSQETICSFIGGYLDMRARIESSIVFHTSTVETCNFLESLLTSIGCINLQSEEKTYMSANRYSPLWVITISDDNDLKNFASKVNSLSLGKQAFLNQIKENKKVNQSTSPLEEAYCLVLWLSSQGLGSGEIYRQMQNFHEFSWFNQQKICKWIGGVNPLRIQRVSANNTTQIANPRRQLIERYLELAEFDSSTTFSFLARKLAKRLYKKAVNHDKLVEISNLIFYAVITYENLQKRIENLSSGIQRKRYLELQIPESEIDRWAEELIILKDKIENSQSVHTLEGGIQKTAAKYNEIFKKVYETQDD